MIMHPDFPFSIQISSRVNNTAIMDNLNDFSGRGPFNPSNKNLLTSEVIHKLSLHISPDI